LFALEDKHYNEIENRLKDQERVNPGKDGSVVEY
jgi:hypothetical protein